MRLGPIISILSALAIIILVSLGARIFRWEMIFWPAMVVIWAALALVWARRADR